MITIFFLIKVLKLIIIAFKYENRKIQFYLSELATYNFNNFGYWTNALGFLAAMSLIIYFSYDIPK